MKQKKVRSADPTGMHISFEPYLAGDRMSIEQKQAAFSGLTLATTREDMLRAVLESLAQASAARIELLQQTGTPISRKVVVTGGAGGLDEIFHRDWPGKWSFHPEKEATLRGLARLEPRT
jgi:sugar (pentulose or hexulose) kinase